MTMIRQVLAILVLTRICASLALILFDGVSSPLEAAAFMIALVGLGLVALVMSRMNLVGWGGSAARRDAPGRNSEPATAR
jgi:uncharacterized membrane protein